MVDVEPQKPYVQKGYRQPSFDEITSHSSMLTNERIDMIMRGLDVAAEDVWKSINIPSILEYHSYIRNLFLNVAAILEEEQADSIMGILLSFYKSAFPFLGGAKKASLKDAYALVFILDRANFLLRFYLQMLSYFFKLGKKPVKGIENAIGIVTSGGGIFGKSVLPDSGDEE